MRFKKRAGGLILAAVLVVSGLQVSAADGKQVSDWISLPGYTFYDGPQGTKQRAPTPAKISHTKEGIQIDCDGYYKVGVEAYSGLIYKEKLALDGLSFEILINEVPGVDSSGGGTDDLWLTFAFLDRPEMFFSQTTDKGGKGLVANLRPGKRDILNQMFTHINDPGSSQGWKTLSSANIKADPPKGSRLVLEFKKQGSYIFLYINNKKQANVWSNLMAQTFPDKKGYLAVATSTDTAKNFSVTITQLNGIKLGDPTATTPNRTNTTPRQSGATTTAKPGPTGNNPSESTPGASGKTDVVLGDTTTGDQTGKTDMSESNVSENTTKGIPTVPPGTEKVSLSKAIKSSISGVTVKADDGVIYLEKAKTMAELRSMLKLADGYRFVFYDINNNEIKDESAEVTVLTNAILYFGSDVEKVFTFEFNKPANQSPSGLIWLIWIAVGVIILVGAYVAVYFLIIRKKFAVKPQ